MQIQLHQIVSKNPIKIEQIKTIELDFVPPIGSRYTDESNNKTYEISGINFTEKIIIALLVLEYNR